MAIVIVEKLLMAMVYSSSDFRCSYIPITACFALKKKKKHGAQKIEKVNNILGYSPLKRMHAGKFTLKEASNYLCSMEHN